MLPPAGRRRWQRTALIAAAVAFLAAALVTALVTREPALAGGAPGPDPAPARTSRTP